MAVAKKNKKANKLKEIINIVPLRGAVKIKSTAAPKLIYNGGPLLSNVAICPVFWGDAWEQPAQKIVSQYLYEFLTAVVASPFISQLSEYTVPQYPIGFGSVTDIVDVPHTFISPIILDLAIRRMLRQQIANATLPPVTNNRLYFVYLPPGVKVQKGIGISCITFCGYHDAINNNIFYAVVPYTDCAGCLQGLSLNDALTSISSHELAEAITDPIPGTGWYDTNYGEVGDICAWKTAKLPNTNYLIQLEWSNKQNACVL